MTRTLVHLVRHGQAENPHGIWYGRMEGFPLSDIGLKQAESAANDLAERQIAAVYASPITRAAQTAEIIGRRLGLEVKIEPLLIETTTRLEGRPADLRIFRNPFNARHFYNPFRPSWGEPYVQIRERMTTAIKAMVQAHAGAEVAAVSHMTPILIARLHFEGNPKPPWRAKVACSQASITTLQFEDGRCIGTSYRPNG